MSDESNTTTGEPTEKKHPVRWKTVELDRIKLAAKVWSERDGLRLTMADVIRTGGLQKADEILGPAA